jgi:tryptophanyl-tRNA synthetase
MASTTELKTESLMTPWAVKGTVDYMAQISHFGTSPIDGELIKRWEKVTGTKCPHQIRRGLVFSHQDIDKILDNVEKNIPVYLYTGRGPSGESMHLGHLIPFMLTKYLQDALNCIVVIQLSDDEKFFFKDGSKPEDLETYRQYSYANARTIIACGFDPAKTLIFSNLEHNCGDLYFNNVLIMKANTVGSVKSTYGLGEVLPESVIQTLKDALIEESSKLPELQNVAKITEITATIKKFDNQYASNLGQCVWPAFQSGPAFCTSFRQIFQNAIKKELNKKLPDSVKKSLSKVLHELSDIKNNQSIMCLVPMAIDQAPYFRMARDDAPILRCPKPAVIHTEFLPGLQQSTGGKMSTTGDSKNATLFLDIDHTKIKKMIKSYAFSGGGDTRDEHREYGGNIRVDISYQYLTFFLESDEELAKIAEEYTSGRLESGDLKEIAGDIVARVIAKHQEALKLVTDDIVEMYFDWDRVLNIGGCYAKGCYAKFLDDKEPTDYSNYGINFDRTFGFSSKPKPAKT